LGFSKVPVFCVTLYYTSLSVCPLKSFDKKLLLRSDYIDVFRTLHVSSNPTGPLFTRFTSNFPRTKERKSDWKCYQRSERVCKVHSVKESQNDMQQLHVTITTQKHFIQISVLNLFYCFQKFWVFHFIKFHEEFKISIKAIFCL